VLVYSEFAGCATSFEDGALVVNPHDTDGVAQSLHAALTMTSTTKQVRHHKLARYVNTYTAELWSNRLVKELRQAREKAAAYEQLLPLDVAQLRSFYERSRRRLLVFEYDGTLAPHASLPQLAQPPPALAATLAQLCADPHNTVYVLSGRSPSDLDEWLAGQDKRAKFPTSKAHISVVRFPLVSADFWTSDHLSERSRSVDAFSGTRARGTLMLKRR
jgi:trehalose 6-phosphate synthase/phosphatase